MGLSDLAVSRHTEPWPLLHARHQSRVWASLGTATAWTESPRRFLFLVPKLGNARRPGTLVHVSSSGAQFSKWECSTCFSTRNDRHRGPAPPGSICEDPRALTPVQVELQTGVPLQSCITEITAFFRPPPQEEGSLVGQICLGPHSPSDSPGPRLAFNLWATSLGLLRREQTPRLQTGSPSV